MAIIIPEKFEKILKKDYILFSAVLEAIYDLGSILQDNKLFFFEDYTDHGEQHINAVLKTSEAIISDETYEHLNPGDIATLVLAILLHDLGMHTYFETFSALLDGKYDDLVKDNVLIANVEKTWLQIWNEYKEEFNKMDSKSLEGILGAGHTDKKFPSIDTKEKLNGYDKKIIGEFIRRNHPRIAYEISQNGIISNIGKIEFGRSLKSGFKKMAGLVAFSHGTNIRNCFQYLKTLGGSGSWKKPYDVDIVFLMIVIRISDYFQIDNSRVSASLIKIKSISSPISKNEFSKHLSVEFIKPADDDSETLYVQAEPRSSFVFVSLSNLLKDIQNELDMSWAVHSEIYGKLNYNFQPKIKFRRIRSNINDTDYLNRLPFVAEKFNFDVDKNLLKLLISPLYGDNSSYGFRELIQNSLDACNERDFVKTDKGDAYTPIVKVFVEKEDNSYSVIIKDNGKGMSLKEIGSYFLRAGASLRKSSEWKQRYTNISGLSEVRRTGKFGIGALAAFLIGDRIEVLTRHYREDTGYKFSCNLDDEFIEITYIKGIDIGTTIKIINNSSPVEKMLSQQFPVKWNHWYVLTYPEVRYFVFDIEVKQKNVEIPFPNVDELDNLAWNYFETEDYKRVFWSYAEPIKRVNGGFETLLACNGILIPNSYPFFNYVNLPFLSIFDYDGKLPLNLSRNSMNDKLFFDSQLLEEICKDTIAQLLVLSSSLFNFDNYVFVEENLNFSHKSNIIPAELNNILVGKDSFILDHPFFMKNISKSKNIVEVYVADDAQFGTPKSNFNIDMEALPNSYIIIKKKSVVKDPYNRDRMSFEDKKSILTKKFVEEFNAEREYISMPFETNYNSYIKSLDIEISEDFIVEKVGGIPVIDSNFLLSKLKTKTKDTAFFLSTFSVESYLKKREIKATVFSQDVATLSETVDKMLTFYLGNDVEIPYNIDERMNKFSFAFEKLDLFMKRHLNPRA